MGSTAAYLSRRLRHRRLALLLALALGVGLLVAGPPRSADAATCPCTIFSATQTPTNPAENDSDAVELGVKFRADSAGVVTGVRFYKGTGNTGTHTGSLWSSTGTRLATVTFTGESASGWQQANFATPVAITANTTYVASYYAPNGHYAADASFFDDSGVDNAPLTALQNGVDGGNGVYRYASGGGFPTGTFASSNYWVDVVFDTDATDTTKPTVTDRQPAAGATGVPVSSTVTATFSEGVQATTVAMTLSGGSAVPATTSYDSGSRTVTLTPNSALTPSTGYSVSLSGARDAAGNQMDPMTWTFTTAATATGCPCTVWPGTVVPATAAAPDTSAVEVGVKFRTSQAGFITGIRFYKGTGNTGTHVGSLWNRTGTKLATVTFTGETATGWQQATFGAPVAVSANTTYVASYHAPVGRYSVNYDFFTAAATTRGPLTALRTGTDGTNGVYLYGAGGFPTGSYRASNYWVDVVFETSATDTTAPTVLNRAPEPGASGVATSSPVTATFSEPVVEGSVVMQLRGPGGAVVPASVSYSPAAQTVTLTPSAALASSTTYTASLSGARDAASNTMAPLTWSFTTGAPPPPPPDQGPGGPIAVVTSSANPYSKYLAEIMRAEGLNEFATIDVGALSAGALSAYDVVVLGSVTVTAAQATTLNTWVTGGGNLIAMKPSGTLSGLLGITASTPAVTDGYLKVNTATAPGAGIVSDTIQFHGPSDRYTANTGTQSVATLYTNATAATTSPAVTLRSVGTSGGDAAAFTYDLPRSIVLTRQGNPAWAGTERDGQSPIRSDDMFFGGTATDWVNLNKVAIPQADEQQRLLANLIEVMNRDKKPLPRFWYFPRSLKAVVIGTGDDHGNGGTAGRFDQYLANSPAGCSVADWTCLRFSSYVYPSTPGLSGAAALAYHNQGFEVGVHPSTGCGNYTAASIASDFSTQLPQWRANYPGLPSPATSRMHCIAFSDWASQPKTEVANGIRLDGNYYYWPAAWVQNRPGFMTGSGMPMRFADTDGTMIDIFQSTTQMTDESGQTYPFTPDTLLDNATGPLGYYGAFNANMHTDAATIPQNDALIASAKARGVPIISGKQMLTWIDGRNGSTYSNIAWNANTLTFSVGVGTGANGLTGMLPTAGPNGSQLTGLSRAGSPVPTTASTIKGLEYATFSAAAGAYTATYSAPGPLAITGAAAVARTGDAQQTATIAWRTSEVASSEVTVGTAPDKLSDKVLRRDTTRRHAMSLDGLEPGTKYYYRVTSTDTMGEKRTYPAADQAPATFTTPREDRSKPTATVPVVTALPGGTALVQWETDEPTTALVRVGKGADKLADAARDDTKSRRHSLVLTSLEPNRSYWLSAESTDAAGNRKASKARRFSTPAPGVAEQMTASFERGTTADKARVDADGTGSITLSGGTKSTRQGVFTSGFLDAQAMVDWSQAIWRADVPNGGSVKVSVRTGSTLEPDRSWSSWRTVPADGKITGSGRYLQYKITLKSNFRAPAVYAIGFTHNGAAPKPIREGR